MKKHRFGLTFRHVAAVLFTLLLAQASLLQAQQPPAPPPPGADPGQQAPLLSPNQLQDLVAPIALYPDPILSQVLVASTYPLEVMEAYQWLQRNPGLTGAALTQAADQQNWDPSVQALVMFPDVMKQLSADVTWVTNLGNAFLQQQDDVMNAVQGMRLKAQQAGKLSSTPQQEVSTTSDSGQQEIVINPVSPDVIYVPEYDPLWIWGPPVYYPYPRWFWPPRRGPGFIFFGGPIQVGLFFGGGWGGWGGWGWHPGWGSHTIIVNNVFIHRYGFNSNHVANITGTGVWSHDASHRLGVPYPNRALSNQYRAGVRDNLRAPGGAAGGARPEGERMGDRQIAPNTPNRNHTAFGSIENGANGNEKLHTDHGYSSLGPGRTAPAPQAARPSAQPAQRSAPAPRSAPQHSAPSSRRP
jgi:Protein of unknown function (DUF3300)